MTRPTLRERLKPVELVGIAGVLALFAGLVALGATREIEIGVVLAGIAFIVGLLVLAMLALAVGDPGDPDEQRPLQDRNDERREHDD